MTATFKLKIAILTFNVFAILNINAQINFTNGSQFKYLKGNNAASIPTNWYTNQFNADSWQTAQAPFRYGDGTGGTLLSDMQNNYTTLYLKSTFTASQINKITNVDINVNYDDGFIMYINGTEVLRKLAPTNANSNSVATDNHESGGFEKFNISISNSKIIEGQNSIAIQAFNVSRESSDFYFDTSIEANISLPETNITTFPVYSHSGGYYNQPFGLTLTSPSDTLHIVYTIDGSNPQTSVTAINGGQKVTIPVDPANTNRPQTPGFIVRASLAYAGYKPGLPTAQTYIFYNNVLTQKYPGGNWPANSVNNQWVDYDMDTRITQSTPYSLQMAGAFAQLPTISVVTDNENLFSPTSGIYVNALNHGDTWERFCSVQLIDPDADSVFNVNAGLRIRGGWSRHSEYPKHAFRLFFRGEYGFAKLRYPLFGDEGVTEFDKIDLRCEQNYAWCNGQNRNSMVREVFSRDSQRDMQQPYTRSRYYHLFLNGMYWGMYMTQERAEARFASDYFGDKPDDYDVVKVNGDYSGTIEATDGNLEAWRNIYNKTTTGFVTNKAYFELEGKDEFGNPKKGSRVLVDIDNLIDYMITIFYTGNFDAPVTAFGGNDKPNNFYTIFNRNDKTQGFKFFAHDAEHSLMYYSASPGIGINENRVSPAGMSLSSFSYFHPQWLHHKLTANPEYRQRFADRAYKHLTGNGVFTPEACKARILPRTQSINMAVVAESARWGDTKNNQPYTKDNDWLKEIETLNNYFFPKRTNIVISQLKTALLYPAIDAPQMLVNSTNVSNQTIEISGQTQVTINNPNNNGQIYLTDNGIDPRKTGGGSSGLAKIITSGTVLQLDNTAIIKARVYNNNTWSALVTLVIKHTTPDYSGLRITEIHYHPSDSIINNDTIDDKSFEFIEFKNVGQSTINLSGIRVDSAVSYTFPDGALLPPGQFWVIASKPKWFYERYGIVPSGNYSGNLANSGEYILVETPNEQPLITFAYSDDAPWPIAADGDGNSLHCKEINPENTPDQWQYWKPSRVNGGSPFKNDLLLTDINEKQNTNAVIAVYPNPTTKYVTIGGDSDTNYTAKIYDVNGHVIWNGLFTQTQTIDLQKLHINTGIYVLHVSWNNGFCTKKIVFTNVNNL